MTLYHKSRNGPFQMQPLLGHLISTGSFVLASVGGRSIRVFFYFLENKKIKQEKENKIFKKILISLLKRKYSKLYFHKLSGFH
jgi:hypothetical protein